MKTITAVCLIWLTLAASPAAGLNLSLFSDPDSAIHACLLEHLSEDEIREVVKHGKPSDRKLRKRVRTAHDICLIKAEKLPLYDGPLFDAMAQIDRSVDMDAAMKMVRDAGVYRMALFARSKKTLHENETAVLDLARGNPDLLVLGAPKYFPHRDDLDAVYVRATLAGIKKHGYQFVGEILYAHGDKEGGEITARGERWIDPLAPRTRQLLAGLAGEGLPLMVHFEAYAIDRDGPSFHKLFSSWPDQVFIVPHMAFASPEQVTSFLEAHPNLYMTISKKHKTMGGYMSEKQAAASGSNILNGSLRLRPQWHEVLTKFQDRLLFATDAHMRMLWESYPSTVRTFRILLGQLPGDVAEKIAFRNAERVYGVAVRP